MNVEQNQSRNRQIANRTKAGMERSNDGNNGAAIGRLRTAGGI